MKTFRKDNTFSYKEVLFKCAIFIVTVSVIVYFMPREGKFNYQFELNKPWKYEHRDWTRNATEAE